MRIELGMPLTLGEIAKASGGKLQTDGSQIIKSISSDTRNLKAGDLFIALIGNKYDGTDYVHEAKNKGAFILSRKPSISHILHASPRLGLLDLASKYAQNLPYLLYKIGITGSVGKTTTKEFLKILLSSQYRITASEGNFNNDIGMPMSILSAKADTQILIMEMGMNAPGEISRLSRCLRPDIALITNIGTAHIGKLGGLEEIALAKLEIIDGMSGGKLLLPDDKILTSRVDEYELFSTKNKSADYYLEREEGRHISLYAKKTKFCSTDFHLTENHHLDCLAAACSIAVNVCVTQECLQERIALVSKDNIRQKDIYASNYHFIDDSYNACLESMISAIDEFCESRRDAKKSLVLGDILELGEMSDEIHFKIGMHIAKKPINYLFLFGSSIIKIKEGAVQGGFPKERIFINTDISRPSDTARKIKTVCAPGEAILLKASRKIGLERVLSYFSNSPKEIE